ncbi:sensor histidine kinase [Haloplanus sp. C73]|uniref:sensor histidine kinase n=1 Tax=Haloplanus sp. C73 TaxID=3421641 RepID=UPI003EB9842D
MTDACGVTLDDVPDPMLAYTTEGDTPRITATNDAFERTFEPISAGQPVETVFDRCSVVNSTAEESPTTNLLRGDRVSLYLDGGGGEGPFFARTLPSGDETGYLVFSDAEECLGLAEGPAIGQVSSVISHDLRNPLDVAKAHLRAARETGDAEHFETVADAHDRMERIIRDVLTMTRAQTPLEPSDEVPIEVAVAEAWESVDTRGATLDVQSGLPTVTADPEQVRRLFENLFRNAVEHGPAGGEEAANRETVTLTVGALEDGFYVTDDGTGIPPDETEVVFERGYSTRDDGTGLGLAIIDRIVTAHGWEIALTTPADGGARFEIRL